MTERTSFLRKIAYGIAIVVLAVAMLRLSAPATATKDGGKLAELAREVPPRPARTWATSIRPARPSSSPCSACAAWPSTVLWEWADEYKKKEDWTNLTATLEQLAKLQPNFIIFWKFQAWNLTYNVSVEFDDYKDRYFYVRRGIEFLREGEHYNIDNPQLLWDLGWFIGQKIGRADEHVQYRQLFRADETFLADLGFADRPLDDRDNWLVGKEAYLDAIDAVDNKGHSIGRKSPRGFYSSPAMSQMNYAEAIEEEGYFERARRGWEQGGRRVARVRRPADRAFDRRESATGFAAATGKRAGRHAREARRHAARHCARSSPRKNATRSPPKSARFLDTPADKLTPEQAEQLYHINEKIAGHRSRRGRADRPRRAGQGKASPATGQRAGAPGHAAPLHDELQARRQLRLLANPRRLRADGRRPPGPREDAPGEKSPRGGRRIQAKKLYEEGFAKWRQVIDKFPTILDEEANIGEDILEFVKGYRDPRPARRNHRRRLPLWDVIEKFDREQNFTEELAAHKERQAEESGDAPPAQPATQGEATQTESTDSGQPEPTDTEVPAETPQANDTSR